MRRHRRTIGIPLVVAAALLAKPDLSYLIPSVILVTAGECIRIWSAGHLRKEQILTTGGPYRFVRNPLYAGSFSIAAGFSWIAGSIWIWLLALTYFLLCYIPVVRYEEKTLQEKFPDAFPDYAARVPAFHPALRPYPSPTTFFSWKQVLRNKEYNAVLGILLGYLFLILRNSY